jgi:Protein of unknown function (DUF1573)
MTMRSCIIALLFWATPQLITAQEIIIEDPTNNKGKVEWDWRVSVGDIPQNVPVTGEFKVKNLSDKPLQILNVQASCRCTVADFTKEPIPSGGMGYIKAVYDAKHEGQFYKILSATTNFDPQHPVVLALEGTVIKRTSNEELLKQSTTHSVAPSKN